jgi:hypothetical protein
VEFAEADDLEPQRIDAAFVNSCTTLAARAADSSQLDGNAAVLDRPVVGVALDADRIGKGLEHLGQLVEHRFGGGAKVAGTARKQDVGVDFDFQPHVLAAHRHELGVDQGLHGVLHLRSMRIRAPGSLGRSLRPVGSDGSRGSRAGARSSFSLIFMRPSA